MSVWWSYSLRDLLLFAPHTYYRLFELYNLQFWPLPLLWLVAGATIYLLWWRRNPAAGRAISAILALAWLWVGWAYHTQLYTHINWAARYYALGFMLQALLIFWLGIVRNRLQPIAGSHPQQNMGVAMLVFAVLCYPLLGLVFERSLLQAEYFGMAPDPTALATLGILLLMKARTWWLYLIPVLWCAISGATLWAMHAPDF